MATVMNIIKWASIPVLLTASLFVCCTASYELLVDFAVCVGTILFVGHAIRRDEYYWAAGFLAIGMMFTPLALVVKIVLLAGFACIAAFRKAFGDHEITTSARRSRCVAAAAGAID